MSEPGTVSPAHLDKIRELHGAVRDWIERSAVAQRNEHIRANLPYVDLMFAFGFATLGDPASANQLVEHARKVREGPIPEGGSPQTDQAVTSAIVHNFLLKAFKYRVDQALSGQSLRGPLSAELAAELEAIRTRSRSAPINNPYKLAAFVIDHFRMTSRIVEPSASVDPYAAWTNRGDETRKEPAGGRTQCASADRALPSLAEARTELLNPNGNLQPKGYIELARAYVAALGHEEPDSGLASMVELFRKMDPAKISNTWTTAQYYSRFHLNLVEDTVLAIVTT